MVILYCFFYLMEANNTLIIKQHKLLFISVLIKILALIPK